MIARVMLGKIRKWTFKGGGFVPKAILRIRGGYSQWVEL